MRIGERIASRLRRVIAERLRYSMATAGAESAPLAHPDGNPFLAARHEFMNAFGDLARGKRNWQLIAYALAGLLALVALADLRLAASSRVVPYIVQVDRLGQVGTVGPADDLQRPDQRPVASEPPPFIPSIRPGLPAGAAAGRTAVLRRAPAFVAAGAARLLKHDF